MNNKKIIYSLKRVILPVILYIVYALIAPLTFRFSEKYMMVLFCGFIAILMTPLYNNITIGTFSVNSENVKDYIMPTMIFFATGTILCFISVWFGMFFLFVSAYMYYIGNCVYSLGGYIKYNKENETIKYIYNMAISSVMAFMLYLLLHMKFISFSWVSGIGIGKVTEIIFLVAVTAIFRLISKRLFKVYFEMAQDYIILLSFLGCIATILYFVSNLIIGEEEAFALGLNSLLAIIVCIKGNVIYYLIRVIWNSIEKKGSNEVDRYWEKDENNRYWEEDENNSYKISSEIIMIPGIDDDVKEGKKDSVSAENSRDT